MIKLSKALQNDLGQRRSDQSDFKSYLSHHTIILPTEEVITVT